MDFTAPQRFLLENNQAPGLEDYMRAIKRKPGALEVYLRKARKAGFSNVDVKALLGFAQKEGLINMSDYKFQIGQLDLAKTRKMRRTGKIDNKDAALHDDADDPKAVTCVRCKKPTSSTRARLGSGGWNCFDCLGRTQKTPEIVGGEKTIGLGG